MNENTNPPAEGQVPQSNKDLWDLSGLDEVFEKYGIKDDMDRLAKEGKKNQEIGLKIGDDKNEKPVYVLIQEMADALKAKEAEIEAKVTDVTSASEAAELFKKELDTRRAQLDQKSGELNAARATYIAQKGVTFDYKDFMINRLAVLRQENKDKFDDKEDDTKIMNKIIKAATRSRAKGAFNYMSYQAKKIVQDNYQELFEENGDKDAAQMLEKANNRELSDVSLEDLIKTFEQVDKYSWETLGPSYKRLVIDLHQFVKHDQVYDSKEGKYVDAKEEDTLLPLGKLGRGDQIRRGVKEDLTKAIENEDWLDAFEAIEHQIGIYDSEINRLKFKNKVGKDGNPKPRFYQNMKRQTMLEGEKKKLENLSDNYFKRLIPFQGLDAPTEAINVYLTNTWLISHENDGLQENLANWVGDELAAVGIDITNKDTLENVTIEFEYVPMAMQVGKKQIAYDIHKGTCSLKVVEKKNVTNQVQHVGEFNAPIIYKELKPELFEAVRYLGIVDGAKFYTNVKGETND